MASFILNTFQQVCSSIHVISTMHTKQTNWILLNKNLVKAIWTIKKLINIIIINWLRVHYTWYYRGLDDTLLRTTAIHDCTCTVYYTASIKLFNWNIATQPYCLTVERKQQSVGSIGELIDLQVVRFTSLSSFNAIPACASSIQREYQLITNTFHVPFCWSNKASRLTYDG